MSKESIRRGYVGVSSPIGYDVSQKFKVEHSKKALSHGGSYNKLPYPNPILECPFGLLLLYDEIWFLSRALCPRNMHDLPYVKFVLESPSLGSVTHKFLSDEDFQRLSLEEYFDYSLDLPGIRGSLSDVSIDWESNISDSSEIFMISNQPMVGMAGKPESVMIDLVHISHLDIPDIELVLNRFTTPTVERLTLDSNDFVPSETSNTAALAEKVLLDRIPNYLSPEGPYHECIEEAREDKYLQDFRKWLTSHDSRLTESEIKEAVEEANEVFRRLQFELFDRFLSSREVYFGGAKTILYAGLDLLAPGLGTSSALLEGALKGRSAQQIRWQGFLASQERRAL